MAHARRLGLVSAPVKGLVVGLLATGLVVAAGCGEPGGAAPGRSSGSGVPAAGCAGDTGWACKGGARERCASGSATREPCERGCFDTPAGSASCAFPSSGWSCSDSAHAGAQLWTCRGDKLTRCDETGAIEIRCEHGCTANPVGTEDTCNAPAASPTPTTGGGFGYPVGDKVTPPAGGWKVAQVLGHYLNSGSFVGGHLAEDVAQGSESKTVGAPVHAIADGKVLYAGPNASTYKNVVLIEHKLADGQVVCSFYGHLDPPSVQTGQTVSRGQPIAAILDWAKAFGGANSHLHYVLLSEPLCRASAATKGQLICGYDNTSGPNGINDLASEPATYTSLGDVCGTQKYKDAFIAPSKFVAAHHF